MFIAVKYIHNESLNFRKSLQPGVKRKKSN